MNKKEWEKAKKLKEEYPSYKNMRVEEIIKLERLRKVLSRVRNY